MTSLWITSKTWIKTIAGTLVFALLFTMIAPPIAQASVWDERAKALEGMKKKKAEEERAFTSIEWPPPSGRRGAGLAFYRSGIEIPKEFGDVVETWEGRANVPELL